MRLAWLKNASRTENDGYASMATNPRMWMRISGITSLLALVPPVCPSLQIQVMRLLGSILFENENGNGGLPMPNILFIFAASTTTKMNSSWWYAFPHLAPNPPPPLHRVAVDVCGMWGWWWWWGEAVYGCARVCMRYVGGCDRVGRVFLVSANFRDFSEFF